MESVLHLPMFLRTTLLFLSRLLHSLVAEHDDPGPELLCIHQLNPASFIHVPEQGFSLAKYDGIHQEPASSKSQGSGNSGPGLSQRLHGPWKIYTNQARSQDELWN